MPHPLLFAVATLFAQVEGGPGSPAEIALQILPYLLIGAAAWALLIKPERDRFKKQQDVLGGLKKNDRVVTSSGIYGTVASVDRDAGRVVLKVDEAANVKIQVALSTIASVLDASSEPGPSGA